MENLKDSIQQYYDDTATIYNTKHGVDLYGNTWGLKKYYLPLFDKYIPDNLDMLEIGCGTGKYTEIMNKRAKKVIGMDISDNMLDMARKRVPGVEFIQGDCEKLDMFEDGQFDIVYGVNAFSYFPNKEEALKSIHRVLKKDGIFMLIDVNGPNPVYLIAYMIGRMDIDDWYSYLRKNTLKYLVPMLENGGFEIKHKDIINWIPNALPKSIVLSAIPFDFVLSRIPFIKKFAMRTILVATKN